MTLNFRSRREFAEGTRSVLARSVRLSTTTSQLIGSVISTCFRVSSQFRTVSPRVLPLATVALSRVRSSRAARRSAGGKIAWCAWPASRVNAHLFRRVVLRLTAATRCRRGRYDRRVRRRSTTHPTYTLGVVHYRDDAARRR